MLHTVGCGIPKSCIGQSIQKLLMRTMQSTQREQTIVTK